MEENSEILLIFNRYKDTFYSFINSSNLKSSDQLKLINEGSYNEPKSKNSSMEILKRFWLDKNVSNKSAQ